ncbi:adenylate/guanylate cyclase domain-containing protein [Synechococcus elongatus]|uniref:Adenylate/guanylate cyclase domain-containing protein n=1 Tax=Synechococcus elongatus PCC 11802 TaxID=2283154 RepID=A0AAT9K0B1_SYNEL
MAIARRLGWPLPVALGGAIALAGLLLSPLAISPLTQPGRWLDAVLLSAAFRLRGPQAPDSAIAIVVIDEDSLRLGELFTAAELAARPPLADLQDWPWPRRVYALALQRLRAAGARRVIFDIVFATPSRFGPDDDRRFADAIAQAGSSVTLAGELEQVDRGAGLSQASLAQPIYEHPFGLANLVAGADGSLQAIPGQDWLQPWQILQPRDRPPLSNLASAALGQALSPLSLGINYSGPEGTYPRWPFWALFDPELWQGPLQQGAVFRDRDVLIGASASSLGDRHATPFAASMAGVEIQANAIATLRSQSGLRSLPLSWLALLVILVAAVKSIVISRCPSPLAKGIWLLGSSAAVLLACFVAFLQTWLVSPTALLLVPLLVGVGDSASSAWQIQRERRSLRRALALRVSPALLSTILAQRDAVANQLGGHSCEAVILFSDLRGFTQLSSQIDSTVLVALLNRYFEAMAQPILAAQGLIDKFVGDAIMAEFGLPLSRGTAIEAQAAIQAALAMRRSLAHLRTELAAEGLPLLFHGIGLNLGTVVAGNLGAPERLEYTVIGDAVNVAARLEGLTKTLGHDIVISQALYEQVKECIEVLPLGLQPVAGRAQPVFTYAVLDERGGDGQLARQVQQDYQAWQQGIYRT